jgi:hypothetical protein
VPKKRRNDTADVPVSGEDKTQDDEKRKTPFKPRTTLEITQTQSEKETSPFKKTTMDATQEDKSPFTQNKESSVA